MTGIIQLLPEAVANQIAAGEVIQRPASAVKELLENAVDAGAGNIQLIIKDAGKTLIQVVDDGCGMSPTDARLCFERHATSKIRSANDLFAIRTLGFRGEALASIAAIAQVELRTRRHEDELGTLVIIEGTEVKNQQPVQCQAGSSFAVKNLFYNVPARRAFLKSEQVEMRHIIEEFQRVAFVYPQIQFSLVSNGRTIYNLQKGNLRQRIIQLMGNPINTKIIPVEEKTQLVTVRGFVSKPEHSRKIRGEQFLFTNGRFVKIPYFQHAIEAAYEGLIPQGNLPSYFIYLEVDPARIDINIHPTKTEVKFIDEQAIYGIIKAAVRKSIGQVSLASQLEFDNLPSFEIPEPKPGAPIRPPEIKINPDYNPFHSPVKTGDPRNQSQWQQLYQPPKSELPAESPSHELPSFLNRTNDDNPQEKPFLQISLAFILTSVKSGLMVIDAEKAWERIYYDEIIAALDKRGMASQQLLFPHNVYFNEAEAEIVAQLKPLLSQMGFTLDNLSPTTLVIQGIPQGMSAADAQGALEQILQSVLHQGDAEVADVRLPAARSLAATMAARQLKTMTQNEMRSLTDRLFASSMPSVSPSGKNIVKILSEEELRQLFK
ncbi:MAG: DNA mismatch repair endonuclease MutL [Bacteroidales bacterium]